MLFWVTREEEIRRCLRGLACRQHHNTCLSSTARKSAERVYTLALYSFCPIRFSDAHDLARAHVVYSWTAAWEERVRVIASFHALNFIRNEAFNESRLEARRSAIQYSVICCVYNIFCLTWCCSLSYTVQLFKYLDFDEFYWPTIKEPGR